MSNSVNPYAAPRTELEAVPEISLRTGRRRLNLAVGLAALVLIGSPIAAIAASIDIMSIVASGPILSVIAIILAIVAYRSSLRLLIWIALATLAMCISCFLTIFLLQWNPPDAQTPIGHATVVFAVVIQTGWIFVRSVWSSRATLADTLADTTVGGLK